MSSQENPDYNSTFVFENDFPALLQDNIPPPGKKLVNTTVWRK